MIKYTFMFDAGMLIRHRIKCFLDGQSYVDIVFNEEKGWLESSFHCKIQGNTKECRQFFEALESFGISRAVSTFDEKLRIVRLQKGMI